MTNIPNRDSSTNFSMESHHHQCLVTLDATLTRRLPTSSTSSSSFSAAIHLDI
jgi:hypothetical protein